MKTQHKARVDRAGLAAARFVFISWDDVDTDIIDDDTGCVVYSRPTVGRALECAVAFCRVHALTVRRVIVCARAEGLS